jgi:hypothetical protein
MINAQDSDRYQLKYRRTGRLLIVLFFGGVPLVWLVGYVFGVLFHSGLPLLVSGALLMAAIFVVSIQRVIAYCRWTGKYPYYWLRK